MKDTIYIKVRYAETDMMGIVHHSRYYPWFEAARVDFVDGIGLSYADMEKSGILLPLAETHAKYIHPVAFGDEVRIVTRLSKLRAASLEFSYEVYKGDTLCTEGRTVHAVTGRDFKPLNLKKSDRALWDILDGALEKT